MRENFWVKSQESSPNFWNLEKVVVNIDLRANDKVEVIDGPLNSFVGTVLSVDANAKKCRVNVEMFGRETPVDLDFSQVRKI